MVLSLPPATPMEGRHVGCNVGGTSTATAAMIGILSFEMLVAVVVFPGLEDLGETI